MEDRVPQLAVDDEHSPNHPQNLLVRGINAIARFEHWRKTAPSGERAERLHQHAADIRGRSAQRNAQMDEINRLRMAAAVQPQLYEGEYQEAKRRYHIERATELGERIAGLEAQGTIIAGIRQNRAENKQYRHQKKAQRAANAILRLRVP